MHHFQINNSISNFWYLLHVSTTRVHLQEDGYIYRYGIACFTCNGIGNLVGWRVGWILRSLYKLPRLQYRNCIYRGADKSLAPPRRKQANISVRMAWISFGALPWKKILDDSSRLDVVETARVPDMFPSLRPSWSG